MRGLRVVGDELKCQTGCTVSLTLALDSLKRIEIVQAEHGTRLNAIETGMHTHMATVSANTTSMAQSQTVMIETLKGIQTTNSELVKNGRWSVPLIAVLMIIAIFLFRELGEGGKLRITDHITVESGHHRNQPNSNDSK